MVKTTTGLKAKFDESQKTIQDLNGEIEALTRRNELLRGSRVSYNQPTKASANRRSCEAPRNVRRPIQKAKHVEFMYGDVAYKYINGKPVQVAQLPRYMMPTKSSQAKVKVVLKDTEETFRQFTNTSNTDSKNEDFEAVNGFWDCYYNTARTPSPPPSPGLLEYDNLLKLADDGVEYPFPNFRFLISSKDGFDLLKAGYRIAQEAFYEAARKFWPYIWLDIYEEVSLVRFGRKEIGNYMDKYWTRGNLELCGSTHRTVDKCLSKLIYLRNRLCHPDRESMQSVRSITEYIEDVLIFTLAIGEKEKSDRARSLRNELRRLAAECFDQINHFYPLASLPFSMEEEPYWEPYQEDMFRAILHRWEDREASEKELYGGMRRAAEAWETAYGFWVYRENSREIEYERGHEYLVW